MGTGSFQRVNRPGRGVDNPPPFSAEVKERVQLYICSLSGLFGLFSAELKFPIQAPILLLQFFPVFRI